MKFIKQIIIISLFCLVNICYAMSSISIGITTSSLYPKYTYNLQITPTLSLGFHYRKLINNHLLLHFSGIIEKQSFGYNEVYYTATYFYSQLSTSVNCSIGYYKIKSVEIDFGFSIKQSFATSITTDSGTFTDSTQLHKLQFGLTSGIYYHINNFIFGIQISYFLQGIYLDNSYIVDYYTANLQYIQSHLSLEIKL